MQMHLDPLGGWSGDMFVAALLDTFPDLWPEVQDTILSLGLGPDAACRLVDHNDGILTGRRFLVAAEATRKGPDHHHHLHDHDHHHDHDHSDAANRTHTHHTAWAGIRQWLQTSALTDTVKHHAIAIFTLLAKAEAEVHGCLPDHVAFHEVGAVDSIVDIVAAAQLITLINASQWTSSALPLGSGRVMTSHGPLPVPAPATALLLRDLMTIDDGIGGERVTPTGAALARYLLKELPAAPPEPRRLAAMGTGFGSRTIPRISNCLRVLAFDEAGDEAADETPKSIKHRQLAVIAFEVDDQTPEDLSQGLAHIRHVPGVLDVIQSLAIGKKGRMTTQVQVLVTPACLDAAITACFEETTTIGLRYQMMKSAFLHRVQEQVAVGSQNLNVKIVTRPNSGGTAKTEAADVDTIQGHASRAALRRSGEDAAVVQRHHQTNEAQT